MSAAQRRPVGEVNADNVEDSGVVLLIGNEEDQSEFERVCQLIEETSRVLSRESEGGYDIFAFQAPLESLLRRFSVQDPPMNMAHFQTRLISLLGILLPLLPYNPLGKNPLNYTASMLIWMSFRDDSSVEECREALSLLNLLIPRCYIDFDLLSHDSEKPPPILGLEGFQRSVSLSPSQTIDSDSRQLFLRLLCNICQAERGVTNTNPFLGSLRWVRIEHLSNPDLAVAFLEAAAAVLGIKPSMIATVSFPESAISVKILSSILHRFTDQSHVLQKLLEILQTFTHRSFAQNEKLRLTAKAATEIFSQQVDEGDHNQVALLLSMASQIIRCFADYSFTKWNMIPRALSNHPTSDRLLESCLSLLEVSDLFRNPKITKNLRQAMANHFQSVLENSKKSNLPPPLCLKTLVPLLEAIPALYLDYLEFTQELPEFSIPEFDHSIIKAWDLSIIDPKLHISQVLPTIQRAVHRSPPVPLSCASSLLSPYLLIDEIVQIHGSRLISALLLQLPQRPILAIQLLSRLFFTNPKKMPSGYQHFFTSISSCLQTSSASSENLRKDFCIYLRSSCPKADNFFFTALINVFCEQKFLICEGILATLVERFSLSHFPKIRDVIPRYSFHSQSLVSVPCLLSTVDFCTVEFAFRLLKVIHSSGKIRKLFKKCGKFSSDPTMRKLLTYLFSALGNLALHCEGMRDEKFCCDGSIEQQLCTFRKLIITMPLWLRIFSVFISCVQKLHLIQYSLDTLKKEAEFFNSLYHESEYLQVEYPLSALVSDLRKLQRKIERTQSDFVVSISSRLPMRMKTNWFRELALLVPLNWSDLPDFVGHFFNWIDRSEQPKFSNPRELLMVASSLKKKKMIDAASFISGVLEYLHVGGPLPLILSMEKPSSFIPLLEREIKGAGLQSAGYLLDFLNARNMYQFCFFPNMCIDLPLDFQSDRIVLQKIQQKLRMEETERLSKKKREFM